MNLKQNEKKPNLIFTVRMLVASGLVIAAYIAVMYLTQSFSFGQYQMRIATGLYALAAIHPFLVLPLGLANLLSNALFGGLGFLDMIGGFAAGVLTSLGCLYLRKISVWLVGIPVLIIPTLLVPIWLSVLLTIPYMALVISVGIGQIAPAILAVFLVRYLEKPLKKLQDGTGFVPSR
ncbi:MAG: QueT transporter family protein [Oscillospiraceae bacterium]|nr:QueT transporter family protein [Oscillospiraceae bacterium]